jgi:hypothetical protein
MASWAERSDDLLVYFNGKFYQFFEFQTVDAIQWLHVDKRHNVMSLITV